MVNAEWIARQDESPESRRLFEREHLVAWVFERIAEAMETSGKSKADLARALGTSRSYVTQLMNGRSNATLATLADMAWACESRLVVNIEPLRDGEFISTPTCLVRQFRPEVRPADDGDSPTEVDFSLVTNQALGA